jgi:hypothetical protein
MTDLEIAKALESMIEDDGKRPPEEQIRDLIEAGLIDEQGRVLIGNGDKSEKTKQDGKSAAQNGPSDASSIREAAGA